MTATPVLFDVDGTLLITGGASSRCIRRAAEHIFGKRFQWGPVTVGTLDPQIFRELARYSGFDAVDHLHGQYRDFYLAELEAELTRRASDVKVMPGIPTLLSALSSRSDVSLGLLTGNYRRAVELKLAAAGIAPDLFEVAAYAEDGDERHRLVPRALEQCSRLHGFPVAPEQAILVGDTPRDIACARMAGCHVLAVATGRYRRHELAAEGADVAVDDLLNPEPLLSLITSIQTRTA